MSAAAPKPKKAEPITTNITIKAPDGTLITVESQEAVAIIAGIKEILLTGVTVIERLTALKIKTTKTVVES